MVPKRAFGLLNKLVRPSRVLPSPLATSLRPYPQLPRTLQPAQFARRYAFQIPKPNQPTPSSEETNGATSEPRTRKQVEPHYQLTFTCVPCGTRSTHTVSKQGYHKGSTLITCPSCRNRHIISDHLKIFGNRTLTIEDLMREKGQLVKRGTLGEDGDIEFWEDDTQTEAGVAHGTPGDATRTNDPNAIDESDEASLLRQTRDPSAAAAAPSAPHSTTTSALNSSEPRPQLNSAPANITPSTRRQFHSTSVAADQLHLNSLGVSREQLFDLRSSLKYLDEEEIEAESFDHQTKRGTRPAPLAEHAHEQESILVAPCRIPEAHRTMLSHHIAQQEANGEQPPKPVTNRSRNAMRPAYNTNHINIFSKIPVRGSSGDHDINPRALNSSASTRLAFGDRPLITKQSVSPLKGRPNLYNPVVRAAMGINSVEYEEYRSQHRPPGPKIRFTEVRTKHYKPTFESLGRELPPSRSGTSANVKIRPGRTSANKYISQHGTPAPLFRKIMPPKEKGDTCALSGTVDVAAEPNEAPQRPLPEETYRRITANVESVRNLPPQTVSLEGLDMNGMSLIENSSQART